VIVEVNARIGDSAWGRQRPFIQAQNAAARQFLPPHQQVMPSGAS
jgi:hypothetical protein